MYKCLIYLFSLGLCLSATAQSKPDSTFHKHASVSDNDTTGPYLEKHEFMIGVIFDFSGLQDTKTTFAGVVTGTNTLALGGDLALGYMLTKRLAFQIKGGYSETKIDNYTVQTPVVNPTSVILRDDDIKYYVTPVLRYYFPIADDNYFFLQLRAPFSFGQFTTQTYDASKKTINTDVYNKSGIGAYLQPGFTTFLSKRIAAEVAAGNFGWETYDGKDAAGNITHTGGWQSLLYINSVSLGFVIYL